MIKILTSGLYKIKLGVFSLYMVLLACLFWKWICCII